MACGGARVRDARDLVPIPQATVGTADHDGGSSYARAPPRATKRAGTAPTIDTETDTCEQAIATAQAAYGRQLTAVELSPNQRLYAGVGGDRRVR